MKYLILLLLLLPLVSASTPDYDVYYDINTDLTNSSLGQIVLTKQDYIPDVYIMESYNSSVFQIYDRFSWNGNETIEVTDPDTYSNVVTSGSSYYFSKTGLYTYRNINNFSEIGYFQIVSADILEIEVIYDLTEEETVPTFILTDEKTIHLAIDNYDSLTPRSYSLNIRTTSDYKDTTKDISVTIPENKKFNIDYNLQNLTIKAGEIKSVGEVTLTNTGNSDFYISMSQLGNGSDFIVMSSDLTLVRGLSIPLPIVAQIPIMTPEGNYEVLFRFHEDSNTFEEKMTLNVQDFINPEIKNISFSNNNLFINNRVRVLTDDNIGVKSATLNYYGESYDLIKDNNLFYIDLNFVRTGEYMMEFCITDESSNGVCKTINKTFEKLNCINKTNSLKMPTKKVQQYASHLAFNVTEDVDISLKLLSFETNGNYTMPVLRLKDSDDNTFDLILNKSINVTKGEYFLEIKSDNILKYQGVLAFNHSEFIANIPNLNFNGKFNNYELPDETFYINDYGVNTTCHTTDTGDADTSYVECPFRMDAISVAKGMPILVTNEEIKLFKENNQLVIDDYKEKMTNKNYLISGLFAILIFTSGALVFNLLIKPNLRYRRD